MTNIKAFEEKWKKEIEEEIKKETNCSEIEIISIHSGILVQAIFNDNLDDLKMKILNICVKKHKNLPSGQNAFPFQIHCYKDKDEAYKVEASFKTKLNDYTTQWRFKNLSYA